MRLNVEYVPIDTIKEYENNAKIHTDEQIEQIKKSIQEFGFNDPVGVWHGECVEGHGRIIAARQLGMTEIPIIRLDDLTDEQRRAYMLVHNKLTMNTDFDFDLLDIELEDILNIDMSEFGFDLYDDSDTDVEPVKSKLEDRFIVPPFDVLNARSGKWNERKKHWKELIQDKGQARESAKSFSTGDNLYGIKMETETSILDPVLAEIIIKWFGLDNGKCFDCFAGDTVFGYVSGYLGQEFIGIELRQEQCDFNQRAVEGMNATYICDDGRNIRSHIADNTQDLLFSCPPYYNLEVYSDLENDASNQETYGDFYQILDEAFTNAIKCLKDNRFAVIVVGDIRNKNGAYYNFPNDIIDTFKKNGMILYNNIKLLTPIGTAQIRASKYMQYRKTAHVYQDVLVFYKGNPKSIKEIYPIIEVEDVSENMEL